MFLDFIFKRRRGNVVSHSQELQVEIGLLRERVDRYAREVEILKTELDELRGSVQVKGQIVADVKEAVKVFGSVGSFCDGVVSTVPVNGAIGKPMEGALWEELQFQEIRVEEIRKRKERAEAARRTRFARGMNEAFQSREREFECAELIR